MAVSMKLSNANSSYELTATPYGVLPGTLGGPVLNEVYAPQWGRGHHPLIGHSYGNREITLNIQLSGTSIDVWSTNYRNLQAVLRESRNYWESGGERGYAATLTVQLGAATNATVFDILTGTMPDMAVLLSTFVNVAAAFVLSFPVKLTCKPFGRGASTITSSGTVNAGTTPFVIAAPLGDHEAPLRISWQPKAVAPGRLMMARRTRRNSSNILWPLSAAPGTYSAYTVKSLATASGGGVVGVYIPETSGAAAASIIRGGATNTVGSSGRELLRFTLTANLADWRGRYRALLVSSGGLAAFYPVFALGWGGASGDKILNAYGTSYLAEQIPMVSDLGVIEIPDNAAPATQALDTYQMTLYWKTSAVGIALGGASGEKGSIKALYLLPIDEQLLDVGTSNITATGDIWTADGLAPQPSLYMTDASGKVQTDAMRVRSEPFQPTVVPGVDNYWYSLMFSSDNSTRESIPSFTTTSGIVTASYNAFYDGFSS